MPSCSAPGTRSSGTQPREGTALPQAGEGVPAGVHGHMPLWMPVKRGCHHITVAKQGVLSLSLLQWLAMLLAPHHLNLPTPKLP